VGKMKQCPFCESDDIHIRTKNGYQYLFCQMCGARGPCVNLRVYNNAKDYSFAKRTIAMWNSRTFQEYDKAHHIKPDKIPLRESDNG